MSSKYGEKDMPLLNRATRERWEIPESERPEVVKACLKVLKDPNAKPANLIAAANALGRLDALNLKEQSMYAPKIVLTANISEMSDSDLLAALNERKTAVNELLGRGDSIEGISGSSSGTGEKAESPSEAVSSERPPEEESAGLSSELLFGEDS